MRSRLVVCWLLVCFSCAPAPPAKSPGEIELDSSDDAPLPPLPAATAGPADLRPCRKDGTGCESDTASERPLDRNRRYDIPIHPEDPIRGAQGASVSLVVFSDFQCPYCKQLEPVLAELLQRYPEQLRIIWKNHPLAFHVNASPAAILSEQAQDAGGAERFWAVHDDLFAHQSDLGPDLLSRLRAEHGVPDDSTEAAESRIGRTLQEAAELGVRSTPTSFVNGRPLEGARPLWMFIELIEQELGESSAVEQ